MEITITKSAVDRLAPGDTIHDKEIAGFLARCLPSGKVSFGFRYRLPDGSRPMVSLGVHGAVTVAEARTLAKKRAGEVAGGKNPAAERDEARAKVEIDQGKVLNKILDAHVKRHVEGLKSADNITSAFDRLVRPAIGDKVIYDITRADIVEMMDEIEDESGPVMADRTLAYLRKCFNVYMIGDEKFVSPIIKGMHRVDAKTRRGRRILTDEEIRDVWLAADRTVLRNEDPAPKCFPQFVRLLLLTAQRRTQVGQWHTDQLEEFEGADVWKVEAGDYKNGETQLIPITAAVRKEFPRKLKSGFIVSSDDGETGFSGFSKAKAALDDEIARARKAAGRKPMPHFVFHDLRRTARSIMSRYTTPDIAERVLGHAVAGVRGVYDHYDYVPEKREALEKLAAHVLGVVHPDSRKVVPLHASRG